MRFTHKGLLIRTIDDNITFLGIVARQVAQTQRIAGCREVLVLRQWYSYGMQRDTNESLKTLKVLYVAQYL